MTHPRTDIRNAIVTALMNKTDANANVYASRVIPLEQIALPNISVYCNKETVGVFNESPKVLRRDLSVSVEISAQANENIDSTLDAMALQVEHELMQDHTLGDTCSEITLSDVSITLTKDAEIITGSCVLTYDVTYLTLSVADETEANHVNELLSINAKWLQPEEQGEAQLAEDSIEFEEG